MGGSKTLNRPCVVLSETKSVLLNHRPRNFDGPKTWRSEPFIISDKHGSLARDRSRRLVVNINKRSETSAASIRIDQRKRPPSSKMPSNWTEKSILDNFWEKDEPCHCKHGHLRTVVAEPLVFLNLGLASSLLRPSGSSAWVQGGSSRTEPRRVYTTVESCQRRSRTYVRNVYLDAGKSIPILGCGLVI